MTAADVTAPAATGRLQVVVAVPGQRSSSGGRSVPVSLLAVPGVPLPGADGVPAPPPLPPAPWGRCTHAGCGTALPAGAIGTLCRDHARAFRPWTEDERARLRDLMARGFTRARIVQTMARAMTSIDAEIARLREVR